MSPPPDLRELHRVSALPRFSTISVIGLGYIGLPTAALFASRGLHVIGVDVSAHVVDVVNRGEIHIIEPDLDSVVHETVKSGHMRAVMTPEAAEAFLVAVPTPFKGTDHEPDVSYVELAARAIAPVLAPGNIVILESTSPVGTTEQMAEWLATARPDLSFPHQKGEASDIRIAYCPERVLPGKVMRELVENDRVIGGMTLACSALAAALYGTAVAGECVIASSPRVAEMSKLTENSFRDVNIAFANELSLICDKQDISVWELIQLANRHPRVDILSPGPGVGGHCIAVDPWFIVSAAPEQARIIRTAREVNDGKPDWVIDRVRDAVDACIAATPGGRREDVTLGLYGLAFKPDIDDLRNSPAVLIAQKLRSVHDGPILAAEPNIETLPDDLDGLVLADMNALADVDVHVMLVDHAPFRQRPAPERGIIIDTRGVWR